MFATTCKRGLSLFLAVLQKPLHLLLKLGLRLIRHSK